MTNNKEPMPGSEAEWRKKLTPEQFRILREKGTEPAFSGEYVNTEEDGMYHCAACGSALFPSDTKFHSGSGWPSFWDAVSAGAVKTGTDTSHGMVRTEIMCAKCGGHLGHLFDDGPGDKTGKRYCVNSLALKLEKSEKAGER